MSEPSSNSFSSETEVSARQPSPRDTTLDTSRNHTSQPRVLRWPTSFSTLTLEKSPLMFGTLLVKKNSENSESVIISRPTVPSSCSTSPPETPIEMSTNGTRTSPRSVPTFPFVSLEIRPTSKTEKSRPARSVSTERETSSTMTSLPNPTTNSKSHSFTSWDNFWVTQMSPWSRTSEWTLRRSKWTRSTSSNFNKRNSWLNSKPCSSSQTKQISDKNY